MKFTNDVLLRDRHTDYDSLINKGSSFGKLLHDWIYEKKLVIAVTKIS